MCPGPVRAGGQTAQPAGRGHGQQRPRGLPRRLASAAPAACRPAPSVPGLSKGRWGQPGGVRPLCHPAVTPRAPRQGAQPCRGPSSLNRIVPLGMGGWHTDQPPKPARGPSSPCPGRLARARWVTSLQDSTLGMLEGATGRTGEPDWGRAPLCGTTRGAPPRSVCCCHPPAPRTAPGAPAAPHAAVPRTPPRCRGVREGAGSSGGGTAAEVRVPVPLSLGGRSGAGGVTPPGDEEKEPRFRPSALRLSPLSATAAG